MKTFVAEKFNNTCLFPWPFCTAWLAFTFAGSGVAGVLLGGPWFRVVPMF